VIVHFGYTPHGILCAENQIYGGCEDDDQCSSEEYKSCGSVPFHQQRRCADISNEDELNGKQHCREFILQFLAPFGTLHRIKVSGTDTIMFPLL